MKFWDRIVIVVVVLLLLCLGVYVEDGVKLKILVVVVFFDFVSFEFGINKVELIGSEIILNVFDILVVWIVLDFKVFEGCLVKSWIVFEDGKVFDFQLWDGVKFQDGIVFDVVVVKFFLECIKVINFYVKVIFDFIKEIVVVLLMELKIMFLGVYFVFFLIFVQLQVVIVSFVVVVKYGDKFVLYLVGIGLFMFKSVQFDINVVLEVNLDYFCGVLKLFQVIYWVIFDVFMCCFELEGGGVDIVQ